jgi:hypothetical protein
MLKSAGVAVTLIAYFVRLLVNPTVSRQAALPVRLLDERRARKSLGDHPKTRLKLRLTASAI